MDAHEDVELSDLENDAFIPGQSSAGLKSKPNRFTKWIPQRIRVFFENISRIKVSF
jgi:hypothetical protein